MYKDIVDYLKERNDLVFQIEELSRKKRTETENTILEEMNLRLEFVNSWIEDFGKDFPKVQL